MTQIHEQETALSTEISAAKYSPSTVDFKFTSGLMTVPRPNPKQSLGHFWVPKTVSVLAQGLVAHMGFHLKHQGDAFQCSLLLAQEFSVPSDFGDFLCCTIFIKL